MKKPKPLLFWLLLVCGTIGLVGLAICAFADGYHYAALSIMAFIGVWGALFPAFHD